jgi:transcriptional regulator with XRE-family HTH domain
MLSSEPSQLNDGGSIMNETPKTQEEAAAILGVKPTTLSMWRHKGRGPRYLKIGRSCFYLERDIETWLDAQAVVPAPRIKGAV